MKFPLISVVIPTYNEEKNIAKAIRVIRDQDYPKSKIEILVIDDYSTDNTVVIAKKLRAKIFFSGARHIERSKSIGIEHAKGELLLFADADIQLVGKQWLKKAVQPLTEYHYLVGSQAIYWKYSRKHNVYNRYSELYGVNDPFVYMLGNRGVVSKSEDTWMYPETIISETPTYFIAQFTSLNLPTIGSQGYLARASYVKRYTNWRPYFFHLDTTAELVKKKQNRFALMKLSVEHDYVTSFYMFHKKLYRNLFLFLRYRHLRKYTYGVGSQSFYRTLIKMMTLIVPMYQAIKGYKKVHDPAWFLHPVFCLTVPFMYLYVYVLWHIFPRRKT